MYHKDLYLKLEICLHYMKETTKRFIIYPKDFHRFHKFNEAYQFDGQIYNDQKQNGKAISDFKVFIASDRKDG